MFTHTGTVELRTPRLILRPFRIHDAQAMYDNWASDPVVCRFLTWAPHENVEATTAILEAWVSRYSEPNYYNWAITQGGIPIGNISVVKEKERIGEFEIGYCSSQKTWGKGHMTEALQAVITHLFTRTACNRIMACHDIDNGASGRVMEKAGLRFEGLTRQTIQRRDGTLADRKIYGLVREDWGSEG